MNTKHFLNLVAGNVFQSQTTPAIPTEYYIGLSTTTPNINGSNVNEPPVSGSYQRIKADKVGSAIAGNFAGLDANGNLTDSGKSATDFSKVEASTTAGAISVDGADVTVVEIATDAEVKEMLDEIFGVPDTPEVSA